MNISMEQAGGSSGSEVENKAYAAVFQRIRARETLVASLRLTTHDRTGSSFALSLTYNAASETLEITCDRFKEDGV